MNAQNLYIYKSRTYISNLNCCDFNISLAWYFIFGLKLLNVLFFYDSFQFTLVNTKNLQNYLSSFSCYLTYTIVLFARIKLFDKYIFLLPIYFQSNAFQICSNYKSLISQTSLQRTFWLRIITIVKQIYQEGNQVGGNSSIYYSS